MLVLASGSRHRLQLLRDAGIDARPVPATLDERAIEAPLRIGGASASASATSAAEAKAAAVSENLPNDWVIGADQTLSLGDRPFHKPVDGEDARRTLLLLAGETHALHSAVVLARGGSAVWRHVAAAHLRMRALSPAAIDRYLAIVGEEALNSVGAYQIEKRGVQLMERVEGDHWTIIGLPLLPLLAELRRQEAIGD